MRAAGAGRGSIPPSVGLVASYAAGWVLLFPFVLVFFFFVLLVRPSLYRWWGNIFFRVAFFFFECSAGRFWVVGLWSPLLGSRDLFFFFLLARNVLCCFFPFRAETGRQRRLRPIVAVGAAAAATAAPPTPAAPATAAASACAAVATPPPPLPRRRSPAGRTSRHGGALAARAPGWRLPRRQGGWPAGVEWGKQVSRRHTTKAL